MGTPLCILLVDDSRFFLELETQFLRNTPATILTTSSGEEALGLAREHRPSLVYMDMDMPGMTGVDCCRAFKEDPAIMEIPVVLIGNSNSVTDEHDARAPAGAGGSRGVALMSVVVVCFLTVSQQRKKVNVCC
jgi:CheY-like chemotaxis protein